MVDTYACGIQMERPEEDLYVLSGFPQDVKPIEVAHYLRNNGVDLRDMPASERYAIKALGDPYYNALYRRTRSTKALYDAGFFDDGLEKLAQEYPAAHPRFFSTNLEKVKANMVAAGPSALGRMAVIFTTGGMAPIHNGHIKMMEAAREHLEGEGKVVVGGFFAPGHDSYVGQKYGGTAAISAAHRCAMVELAVQDSDWLECDPWAARYMPAEVNFTDVFHRLTKFINEHLWDWIDVYYVCGSDNGGFINAIDGRVIVVTRSELSSKMAREGQHDHLNPAVRDYLLDLNPNTGTLPYLIRNEENDAIAGWAGFFGGEAEMEKRRVQLQSTVRLGIAQVFKSLGHQHKVHLLSVSEQRLKARAVIGDRPVISLDPFFNSTYRIDSTRYFAPAEAQFKPLFRAERTGFDVLSDQAKRIPQGSYVLVEDDSVTGGTIMSAMAVLPSGVEVEQVVLLSDFADYKDETYYDVVDLRDFIVGSYCGGLSVSLPDGRKGRAPYAAPFVSLRSRAKIPADAEIEVSRIVWQANVRFFEGTGIRIENCDEGFRAFARFLDWKPEVPVEDFCRWYVERLMDIV